MDRMLVRTITWFPVIAAFAGCSASDDNNPLDARGTGATVSTGVGARSAGGDTAGALATGGRIGLTGSGGTPSTGGTGPMVWIGTGGGGGGGGSVQTSVGGNGGTGVTGVGGNGGTGATGVGGVTGNSGASGGNGDSGLGSGSFVFPEASAPFTAAGSFPTTSTDVAASACTIYRPTTLGEQGRKHPVIVWGNGTFNTPSSYDALFKHFASHGFIVAAADTSNSGSGTEMIACLEYILKQNTSSGDFQGKVDVDHIAVAGYSQGGAGTLMAGRDPRFLVTCTVSPYVVLPLGGYDSASLKAQVHPMFMISGSADTVAVPSANQQPIYDGAPVPIVWGTFAGASHLEVLGAGGNYAGPMTAWFRFTLMNDQTAGAYFKKASGDLAKVAGWTVQYNSKWAL